MILAHDEVQEFIDTRKDLQGVRDAVDAIRWYWSFVRWDGSVKRYADHEWMIDVLKKVIEDAKIPCPLEALKRKADLGDYDYEYVPDE